MEQEILELERRILNRELKERKLVNELNELLDMFESDRRWNGDNGKYALNAYNDLKEILDNYNNL